MKEAKVRPWEVSEEFRGIVEPLLLKPKRKSGKKICTQAGRRKKTA